METSGREEKNLGKKGRRFEFRDHVLVPLGGTATVLGNSLIYVAVFARTWRFSGWGIDSFH